MIKQTTGTVVEYCTETDGWRVEAEEPLATGWYRRWQFRVEPKLGLRVRLSYVTLRYSGLWHIVGVEQ